MSESTTPTTQERLAQIYKALESKRRRRSQVQQQLSQARSLAGPSVLVAGVLDSAASLRRELRSLESDVDYLEVAAQTAHAGSLTRRGE